MAKKYKLVIFVPISHSEQIRKVLAEEGAGEMGNYDSTSFSVRGVGRFRPLKGANPTIGSIGKLEEVEEERIETIVDEWTLAGDIIGKLKKAHPYEEPAIEAYELKDL